MTVPLFSSQFTPRVKDFLPPSMYNRIEMSFCGQISAG